MTEEKKYDRRQLKTREAVFQALARLLKKKSFANITVQEIIDEANVGRTTFYAHFETKDHLLKAMCESIFDHVLAEHQEKEESHDFSVRERSISELLEHILYHLKDEKEEMLDILLTDSADLFLNYFAENVRRLLENDPALRSEGSRSGSSRSGDGADEGHGCSNRRLVPENDHVPEDYRLQMETTGIVETVRWWAGNRMEYEPRQVAEYYERVFQLQ